MVNCFRCGISDINARLFDVISGEGIRKICGNCNSEEGFPLLKQPQISESEKRIVISDKKEISSRKGIVYERLSRLAGLNSKRHADKFSDENIVKEDLLKKEEKSLRDLVNENYESKVASEKVSYDDLIDNFHWLLMRARRARKLTLPQLAENISESESSIKLAEQGILPDNYLGFVNKLENVLGIKLLKKPKVEEVFGEDFVDGEDISKQKVLEQFSKGEGFNPVTTKTLTISDLQKMKEQKESEFIDNLGEDFSGKKKEKKSEVELAQEDFDKIVFGK